MVDDAGVTTVEVLVYADGGTQVSVPPVEDERRVPLLETAASALRQVADSASRERAPITCRACGRTATAVRASIDGTARLFPCGHATP